ncbi:unnamed protein product [Heligmosomoides polygyrus]|uniref:Uncharacterized protein n=1 Tax=Heligmosomoides polygyrus TaxID=6339 RepID=A0A183FQA2_HELPZ|nr:unnamed protein product [Heligmosomoides polygyrus]
MEPPKWSRSIEEFVQEPAQAKICQSAAEYVLKNETKISRRKFRLNTNGEHVRTQLLKKDWLGFLNRLNTNGNDVRMKLMNRFGFPKKLNTNGEDVRMKLLKKDWLGLGRLNTSG